MYPTKITAANQQAAKAIQKISPHIKVEQKPVVIPPAAPNKPRRIDAKTMHELIAKGPENTTGPWLCLRCGIDGRPISIPAYKSFRRHLVTVHKERIDAKLCEECGYKSTSKNDLHYHLFIKHEIQPPKEIRFPKCAECGHLAATPAQLHKHTQEEHAKVDTGIKTIQQCCYCDKVFIKESTLMSHIKQYHRDQALEDGVIDGDDQGYVPNNPNADSKQIKVLSSVSLPTTKGLQFVLDSSTGQQVTQISGKIAKLEPSSEADALSKVASGIATSLQLVGTDMGLEEQYHQDISTQYITTGGTDEVHLGGDTKILTEDGTELQLTQSQKDEILSQLQSADGNNVIMILNQESYDPQTSTVVSEADNIVVYNEADTNQVTTFVSSQATSHAPEHDEPIVVNMQGPDPDSAETDPEPDQKPSETVAETHESIQKEVEASAPTIEQESETPTTSVPSHENESSTALESNEVSKDEHLIEDQLEKLGAAVVLENDLDPTTLDKSADESLDKSDTVDAAEKAKQNLISTLQGDWTEESEDETSLQKPEEKKPSKEPSPALEPALFEDLEKKPDEHDTSDSKIADAVDDLLNELEGDFDNVEQKKDKESESSSDAKGKDEESKPEATENKELSKLMDDWDDEDL